MGATSTVLPAPELREKDEHKDSAENFIQKAKEAVLLEKVRTKGDPVLDDKKSSAIDGIINMDKSKLSQEELKNLFSEQIAQENILQVGVPLPHRPKQDQPGNNPLKNTVARHYQNQVVSPNSLIRHCDDINPKFEEAKTEPQE
uniref:Uncharacterized protein n=1 Tax=Magallana gigas TaxID=29159 RepID=K1REN8_MAGGI